MKKLILVAVVGFLAVSALRGTKVVSHLRSEVAGIRQWAEEQVPPEKEVARLKNELRLLEQRDLPRAAEQLSRTENEVAQLDERLKTLKTRKSELRGVIDARADAVRKAEAKKAGEPDAGYVLFGESKSSISVAKIELERDVRAYTDTAKALETTEAILAARKQIELAQREQFETLKAQLGDMTREVAALEAEVELLKVEQMRSKYQTDGTRLAKFKESTAELRNKLDVQKRTLAKLQGTKGTAAANKSVDEILAPVSGPKAGD